MHSFEAGIPSRQSVKVASGVSLLDVYQGGFQSSALREPVEESFRHLLKSKHFDNGTVMEFPVSDFSRFNPTLSMGTGVPQVDLQPSWKHFYENWLVLQTSGLEDVRTMTSALEGTNERMVFLVLEKIGLMKFLTNVWQLQEVSICQEFVLKWDCRNKKTTVFGFPIDVRYENFAALTGLGSGGGINHSRSGIGLNERTRVAAYIDTVTSRSIGFSLQHDPVFQSLLRLLYNTVWLKKNSSHYCPSMELLYLIIHSMKTEKGNWSKPIYERFIQEIEELQDLHEQVPTKKLKTLAGPLICFLFSEAKLQFEFLQNERMARLREVDPNSSSFNSFESNLVQYLKQKGLHNYHDHDGKFSVPLGPRREFLSSTDVISPQYYTYFESRPICPLPNASSSSHDEPQTRPEVSMSAEEQNLPQIGLLDSYEDRRRLNQEYEEQKGRQELFKHHLRTFWRAPPRKIPCAFGCCV